MKHFTSAMVVTASICAMSITAVAQAKATHQVIKDDVCWANVADGASKKWNLKKGTKVTFIADQGSYTRISTAEGVECSIATGSVQKI
jgi:hypothetical protein